MIFAILTYQMIDISSHSIMTRLVKTSAGAQLWCLEQVRMPDLSGYTTLVNM